MSSFHRRSSLTTKALTDVESTDEHINVVIRVVGKEMEEQPVPFPFKVDTFTVVDDNHIKLRDERTYQDKSIPISDVFRNGTSNEEIYEQAIQDSQVYPAMDGYATATFVHGNIGTGKTSTLFGTVHNPGIARLALKEICKIAFKDPKPETVTAYVVEISFVELLGTNKFVDLLIDAHDDIKKGEVEHAGKDPSFQGRAIPKGTIEMHSTPDTGAFLVSNPSCRHRIKSRKKGMEMISKGLLKRSLVGIQKASIYPTIFTINIAKVMSDNTVKIGRARFYDLVSERASDIVEEIKGIELNQHKLNELVTSANNMKTTQMCMKRVLETNVKNVLSRKKGTKEDPIPYGDSVLTKFAADALGGNCKTVWISHVTNQKDASGYKSRTTMAYADIARRVINITKPVILPDIASYAEVFGTDEDWLTKNDNAVESDNEEETESQLLQAEEELQNLKAHVVANRFNNAFYKSKLQKKAIECENYEEMHQDLLEEVAKLKKESGPLKDNLTKAEQDKNNTLQVLEELKKDYNRSKASAESEMKEVVNKNRALQEALERSEREKESLKAIIESLQKQHTGDDAKTADLTSQVLKLTEENAIRKKKNDDDLIHINNLSDDLNTAEADVDHIKELLEKLNKELESEKGDRSVAEADVKEQASMINYLNKQINDLVVDRNTAEDDAVILHATIDGQNKHIEELTEDLNEAEADSNDLMSKLDNLRAENASLESEKANLGDMLTLLKNKASANDAEVHGELEKLNNDLVQKQKDLDTALSNLREKERELAIKDETLTAMKEKLESMAVENNCLRKDRDEAIEGQQDALKKLDAMDDNLKRVQNDLYKVEDDNSDLEDKIKDLTEEVEALRKENIALKAQLEALQTGQRVADEKTHVDIDALNNAKEAAEKQLADTMRISSKKIKEMQDRIDELTKKLEDEGSSATWRPVPSVRDFPPPPPTTTEKPGAEKAAPVAASTNDPCEQTMRRRRYVSIVKMGLPGTDTEGDHLVKQLSSKLGMDPPTSPASNSLASNRGRYKSIKMAISPLAVSPDDRDKEQGPLGRWTNAWEQVESPINGNNPMSPQNRRPRYVSIVKRNLPPEQPQPGKNVQAPSSPARRGRYKSQITKKEKKPYQHLYGI